MRFLQLLILFVFSTYAYAQKQTIYESKEYKKAYKNETRLRTGIPGDSYWQNSSDYEISASFDPESRVIDGHLKVTYYNESPDSLNRMVFKLMQNIYKKGGNRQVAIDEINIHDGIQITNVTFNNNSIETKSVNISGTIMNLSLPEYISSKSFGIIELNFETPLAKTSGLRSGTVDNTSFFAGYWFPQVAVYDDIFGWDTDEYVGAPENYNDFSNYQVSITLPSQYNIWATGEHLNKEDIFSQDILNRISLSRKSKKPVMIISESDFRKPDNNTRTWKFHAENVPDFAWAASDHYVWEGVAATNPDPTNLCWVQSAYPVGASHFNEVANIAKKSIEIFSNNFPGVAYPYFKHITFKGNDWAGGMEFPMLANNAVAHDFTNTILVTSHELAHNYFPFMMGINERKYGWWDETMTSLMESYLLKKGYPTHKLQGLANRKMSFNYFSPGHDMLPLITETSNIMKVMPTMINFYVKGPAAMDILVNMIGTKNFYNYTKEFMNTWVGKHPTPYDFFYFINNKEGDNLNWFWDAWFFSFGYPDLGISMAEQNDNYLILQLDNVGGLPVHFRIIIDYSDGTSHDEEFEVDIWKGNLENTTVRIPIAGQIEKVLIDDRFSYDTDSSNNEIVLK